MNHLKVYILWLCFVLSAATALGPESNKKGEDSSDDDEKSLENLESEAINDPEYYNELTEAINKQIMSMQEYADAVSKTTRLLKKEEENLEPNWMPPSKTSNLHENEFETMEENPQDILDALPPLPEEKEIELSPEMKEAKELYELAMAKLDRRSPDLRAAILQVKQAADWGYVPAKIKLAWSYIYGEGVELDVEKAKKIFEELSEEGNADAHAGLGFLYATGVGVGVSQARALLHYTLGALGDSDYAQMALAYRHWAGVTLPSSCPKAMELYMSVAQKVADQVSLNGGPAVQRVRLMDEAEGGGSGAALDTDLIEYYQLLAEKGDVQAQVGLGQLHFQGGRGVTLDLNKALHYFQQASKAGNAVASAFLGKIYLEGGDGIKADNDTALKYFRRAAELNNPVGQSGLGLMYLHGLGVPKDTATAFKYFAMAANQGWVEGQLHLGLMYFAGAGVRRDFKQANKYFSLASQSGHVLALYYLGHMHAQGLGVLRSCTTAVELFKNVCERGPWASRLMLAHAAWRARDTESAFLQYLSLAERGYEVAQSNAAFLLDEGEAGGAGGAGGGEERWRRALQLWARGAAQGCAGARVKLGDYHYYGLGTPRDLDAAAHHYRVAADTLHSAQATFNLGYMHERGLGLARDLHLAKRCYDLAADASPDARLPAALALARLHAHSALAGLLESLSQSPLAFIFLPGESTFLSNWDLYLISALVGALGFVIYLQRPNQPAN
ncbi:protein sel-1 homolog 1 isoform X2 [Nymphalis io]|uniref:protein sel-1 homolog 1 isoform X2 n=1 Tax=Inachis io TaxID=171585 RepID=UPI00216A5F2F|nr:protein sel-1 homolog 1 isoform X2 [Nymphalis io]